MQLNVTSESNKYAVHKGEKFQKYWESSRSYVDPLKLCAIPSIYLMTEILL